ncbi:spore coat protein [Lentibacillus lipolyticus]|nr:spore coat protein [Lentibacillus lipolyticus]
MRPYGGKSKYFYLRDKRRQNQHCCLSCGTLNNAPGYSHCDRCRDKHTKNQYRCVSCGDLNNEPNYSHCNKCRGKFKKHDHHHHHHHHDQFEFVEADTDATVSQDGDQYAFMDQESAEMIWVKESCDITVDSRDTQVGVSLQASLQLAVALVLNVAIADSAKSKAIAQDLVQQFNTDQINKQKIFIYNTKDATVTTRDTDLAINIQVLLQLLITLVVMIDVL